MNRVRQLSLTKRRHRYVFRYTAGHEDEVFAAIASMAADAQEGFDWFDAAVLGYQMGRRFENDPVQPATASGGRETGSGAASKPTM